MRAHTITTITRPRRNAWRRVLALVVGVCLLAIPASAAAYTSPNAITGGSEQSSQPSGGSDQSSVNSITGGSSTASDVSRQPSTNNVAADYSTPNAIAGADQPTVASTSPSSADDGFHWGDAALGAGAAMAVLALAGAVFLTVRRPKPVLPARTTG